MMLARSVTRFKSHVGRRHVPIGLSLAEVREAAQAADVAEKSKYTADIHSDNASDSTAETIMPPWVVSSDPAYRPNRGNWSPQLVHDVDLREIRSTTLQAQARRNANPLLISTLRHVESTLASEKLSWLTSLQVVAGVLQSRNMGLPVMPLSIVQQLTCSLLLADVASRHFSGSADRLMQAVREESGEAGTRWEPTDEEVNDFVRYKSRIGRRHTMNDVTVGALYTSSEERSVAFYEGRDDHIVGRIMKPVMVDHRERRGTVAPLPFTAMEDLMHLSIRWNTALLLLERAKELHHPLAPPQSMYARTAALMVRYDYSGHGGVSRPWEKALQLFSESATVHPPTPEMITTAIDALSFSIKITSKHRSERDVAFVWRTALKLISFGGDMKLRGEEGSNFCEAVVRMCSSISNWELALLTLGKLDLGQIPSHRLLLPSAEVIALAISTCLQGKMEAHATQLMSYFEHSFLYHSLPVDVLLSLLGVLPSHPRCAEIIGQILTRGKLLAPDVAVSCLAALVRSKSAADVGQMATYAKKCLDCYFSGIWHCDEPTRKKKLVQLFHYVYVTSMRDSKNLSLVEYAQQRVKAFAGEQSQEMRLFRTAEIATLPYVARWEEAVELYVRIVAPLDTSSAAELMAMPDNKRKIVGELPYSLAIVKQMLVLALLSFALRGMSFGSVKRKRVTSLAEAGPVVGDEDDLPDDLPTFRSSVGNCEHLHWLQALRLCNNLYRGRFDVAPHRLLCHIIASSHSPAQQALESTPTSEDLSRAPDFLPGGTGLPPRAVAFMSHLALTPAQKSILRFEEHIIMTRWRVAVPWQEFLASELGMSIESASTLLSSGKIQLHRYMLDNLSSGGKNK